MYRVLLFQPLELDHCTTSQDFLVQTTLALTVLVCTALAKKQPSHRSCTPHCEFVSDHKKADLGI